MIFSVAAELQWPVTGRRWLMWTASYLNEFSFLSQKANNNNKAGFKWRMNPVWMETGWFLWVIKFKRPVLFIRSRELPTFTLLKGRHSRHSHHQEGVATYHSSTTITLFVIMASLTRTQGREDPSYILTWGSLEWVVMNRLRNVLLNLPLIIGSNCGDFERTSQSSIQTDWISSIVSVVLPQYNWRYLTDEVQMSGGWVVEHCWCRLNNINSQLGIAVMTPASKLEYRTFGGVKVTWQWVNYIEHKSLVSPQIYIFSSQVALTRVDPDTSSTKTWIELYINVYCIIVGSLNERSRILF